MIPTVHKSIVLFFATVFFFGFLTFIALLEGFGIDHLRFGGVKIEKLYLKWENALLIKAAKIDLTEYRGDDTPLTLEPISRLPRVVRWSKHWIESIDVDTIQYQDAKASLHYTRNAPGTVALRLGNAVCHGSFTLTEEFFDFSLPACTVNDGNVSFRLAIDLNKQHLNADMFLALPQTPAIRLSAQGDTDTLSFRAKADGKLTTVRPLSTFLGLDPDVAPWVVDYAKASSIVLHKLEGTFRYDNPEDLVSSLYASATIENGEYTFAQGFEPIKSGIIDLRFTKGKLHITPHNGSFYALPTEQSRLWIDFTTPNTTLTALIRTTHAQLNDPILNLLRFYGIDLPIRQVSGKCAVNLDLIIDLNTLDTTAKGTFAPTDSQLLVGNTLLQTTGGIVKLDTTRVTFDKFIARYNDNLAHARVQGMYDATREEGNVTIEAYHVSPLGNPKYLRLADPAHPLRIEYAIRPQGDTINVKESVWNAMGETLRIEGFTTAFDYANMHMALSPLPFSIADKLRGTLTARFDGTQQQSDIRLQIDHLRLNDAVLMSAPFKLAMKYNGTEFKLGTQSASSWSIHQLPILISPFKAVWKNDILSFAGIETVAGNWLKANLSGSFNTDTQKGLFRLDKMIPLNPKITPLVNQNESAELHVTNAENEIRLDVPALKARFTTIPEGWQIALDDISLLSRRSPLLRRYHIDNGNLHLYYTGERSQYRFSGSIRYPYPLIVVNNVPLSQYRFNGSYKDGDSTIRVNDRLIINHTPQRTYVRANNTGLNLPELFKFLAFFANGEAATSSGEKTAPVRIHATHTYLYLMKGRKIVADTLDATMDEDGFNGSLEHEEGLAALKIRDGAFIIDGKGFNDTFMKHLFALSDFDGGKFSFQAKGESEAFDGIMRVENTVLKDYKVLNNVLAFINTVPSLTTFSLPNYNSKGLPVQEGYAHFAYSKGILKVDNFTLNSPEMKILGEGKADINARTLEGEMTLKTDLGSKLGKVPMVGYILLGNDGSVSTTLTLSGSLDDPKIETAIAKEIVTAPFNILKRTVIYPFLWMMPDEKKK